MTLIKSKFSPFDVNTQCFYANVLVSNQIKHVNSHMPKVSNQNYNSVIRSCVQNFKLTNENQITIFRSTKVLRHT